MQRLFLVPLACLLFVIGSGCGSAMEYATMEINIPEQLMVGDVSSFSVEVTNYDVEPHTLHSIDISKEILDVVEVFSVEPSPVQELDYRLIYDQISYEMDIDLAPNETTEVVFHIGPLSPGGYTGSLDVCMDGPADCLFNSIPLDIDELEVDLGL